MYGFATRESPLINSPLKLTTWSCSNSKASVASTPAPIPAPAIEPDAGDGATTASAAAGGDYMDVNREDVPNDEYMKLGGNESDDSFSGFDKLVRG